MQPLQHDPNLSDSTEPLLNNQAQVLDSKMRKAVTAVSELKGQRKPVLIIVRENETAMQVMLASRINAHEVATHWPDNDCHSIVNNFNSGIYGIDAVITTFAALKIPGPQFRGGCNQGIMLEFPDDFEEYDMATHALIPHDETEGV
ncbi:hypothetical protein FMEXI_673 [Fusarium mexicanum]|uniref:Uncharacterized protein n=1 Tax=Fusarium mexicanum TaxID=751941 RepID=A0A8H5JLM1_9HYPO|nr:hypothetical protein FMEXI_673 [Fusarium mexicanum]